MNTHERHGRLTFIELLPAAGAGKHRLAKWKCDCGSTTVKRRSHVRRGLCKSCGCFARERSSDKAKVHGMHGSPEYTTWQAMKRRCLDPSVKEFARYGGAGITVCNEWVASFADFFSHVGPRPPGTTLDRIDGSRGYEPGNVRWATPAEQARNRRDLTILNTPIGTMALVDYAAAIGITRGAAHLRMKRGKLEGCTYA